jgi:hypothetical protein
VRVVLRLDLDLSGSTKQVDEIDPLARLAFVRATGPYARSSGGCGHGAAARAVPAARERQWGQHAWLQGAMGGLCMRPQRVGVARGLASERAGAA